VHFRSSLYAINIIIAVVCAAAAPAASAAPPSDACALLTPAQLSATLAVPMDAALGVRAAVRRRASNSSRSTCSLRMDSMPARACFRGGRATVQPLT